MEHLFAPMPIEQQAIARLVLKDARELCNGDNCLIMNQLEHCVKESVDALANARIATHAHLFAIRRVRECIQTGCCDVPLP